MKTNTKSNQPQIATAQGLVLVDKITKAALVLKQRVVTGDGEKFYLVGVEGPRHSGSTGRVYVSKGKNDFFTKHRCYFPSVVNAEWMPEGVYANSLKK